MKIIFLLGTFLVFSSHTFSADLLLASGYSTKGVWVEEKNSNVTIAKIDEGLTISPYIVLFSDPYYFSGVSNWSYGYKFGTSSFDIKTQTDPVTNKNIFMGTRIKGTGLYALPILYYHFNRGKSLAWRYRAGLGVGLGYLSMKGNFRITAKSHPDYNKIKNVNQNSVGLSIGIFLEAAYDKHHIIIRNYAPTVTSSDYDYLHQNVIFAYAYSVGVF